jgi:hypothetical protein
MRHMVSSEVKDEYLLFRDIRQAIVNGEHFGKGNAFYKCTMVMITVLLSHEC